MTTHGMEILGSANRTIALTDSVPRMQYNLPTETSGTTINRRNIIVNVSANDTNLLSITIRLYNSAYNIINSTTTSTSPNYINFSVSADGTYYFDAIAYDAGGNINTTAMRNVIIDTASPAIRFVYPTDNSSTIVTRSNIAVNLLLLTAPD